MGLPKFISRPRRKTIIEEKNRTKVIDESIKYNLNFKAELSAASCNRLYTKYEFEKKQDNSLKADDNDGINRKLDYLAWMEREYKRLKREHYDYMVNCKGNCTLNN
ncbi:uncharacterized protein ELE39_002578 [Cryptosporidium sp. chipmunk genotype I]|uniref:uncharacterized protein n=1 Tax=Cryptosporidium sp. chipmunk genotype I TaxID=1280935 RepID=UPI003519E89D|nr:hypothetical protein ELE39_002578 [Cryptosporidium sp. chipmunk genotype I]